MILSMTGIGRSRHEDDQIRAAVEIRAVNNKFLKLNLRLPDTLNGREAAVDRIVRKYLERGTVTINVQLTLQKQTSPYIIDRETLTEYVREAQAASEKLHLQPPSQLSEFLALPGVIVNRAASLDDEGEAEWQAFEPALVEALEQLQNFRRTEGEAMSKALVGHCEEIAATVKKIESRSPGVVESYRNRLKDRINEWLSEQGVQIEIPDILREVSIFSERCDISEEITRLQSHIDQFHEFLNEKKSTGRKLDFLCQEMFRETNTIASKANDVEISHNTVGMKACVEKMREIVQNIE